MKPTTGARDEIQEMLAKKAALKEMMRKGGRKAEESPHSTPPTLLLGDCLPILRDMDDNSVDSVVTDPPYGLSFMSKTWDKAVPPVEIWCEVLRVLKPGGHLLCFAGTRTHHRTASAVEDGGFEIRDMIAWVYGQGFPKSRNGLWGGTALKPAMEPVTMARKPLSGTVEHNARKWGTGGINVDGCRIPHGMGSVANAEALGRWPANLIHDGSEEVLAEFPDAPGQMADASTKKARRKTQNTYGVMRAGNGRDGEPSANSANAGLVGFAMRPGVRRGDTGCAARFFYCAKASKRDRGEGNTHPTVKPVGLMRYLCRLVTPANGVVLDPFMGSGSTGVGALLEGFRFIGVELEEASFDIAVNRIMGVYSE